MVNLASRTAGFLTKRFDGVRQQLADPGFYKTFIDADEGIGGASKAMKSAKLSAKSWRWPIWPTVMSMSRRRRSSRNRKVVAADLHAICSVGINLFRVLMAYLKPVLRN
ncbi:hypothetical protein ACNKHV_13345 [Shigella flexneri]